MTRILLGQLASNGDCLYATTVARQIKHDFPGAELTWAISSLCSAVIDNNPDVDDTWIIPVERWSEINTAWRRLLLEATNRDFDHLFFTQISPDGFRNYDGTIRPSILRNYGRPITVPVETVIVPTAAERERVKDWARRNRTAEFGKVVLFECASKSGQSFVTPKLAIEIAQRLIAELPETLVVLATVAPVETDHPQIIRGQELSLRETAELTNYADLLIGCASGVTVAATSTAAKPNLPMIEILNRQLSVYASFKHDMQYFGKPHAHILEMTSLSLPRIVRAIVASLCEGHSAASERFGEKVELNFNGYCSKIDGRLLRNDRYTEAAQSLAVTIARYGRRPQLTAFGKALILPFLPASERSRFNDVISGRISPQAALNQEAS
jgi:hypothetical protein